MVIASISGVVITLMYVVWSLERITHAEVRAKRFEHMVTHYMDENHRMAARLVKLTPRRGADGKFKPKK